MNPSREDVLISRVVDREEGPAEWRELDCLAATRGELWEELVDALRQDASVRAAVAPALEAADRSAIPGARLPIASAANRWVPGPSSGPLRSAGWAAALLLSVAWAASTGLWGLWTAEAVATEPAAIAPERSGERSVLGELSRVVVRARPTDDGNGVEVVYVRRVLERAVVRELYQITEDEHGVPVPTQVDLARFEQPTSY